MTGPAVPPAEGDRPAMRRAGMRSVREGCPESVVRIGEPVDFVPPPHDAHFLLDGDPCSRSSIRTATGGRGAAGAAARLREFGLHSLISVPMRARDTVLGLTTFMRSQNPVPFDEDDVAPARELVARAAVCVDNARRYTREHTAALVLQQSLLPHTLRGGTALDVASSYLPADAKDGVGGDWFDVIPLSGPGSAWSSAMWVDTASGRPRPWAGCAPPYRPWPTWTSPRTSCWPAWTIWSCGSARRSR